MTDQLELAMEIRSVDDAERRLVGVVAPYDQTTYLVADPAGERIMRGAFKRSIDHDRTAKEKIPLLDNHKNHYVMGAAVGWDDTDEGLIGTFAVHEGKKGDEFLDDLRHGYMRGLSVGFQPVKPERGADGVREIREAKLVEVSAVGIPAYDGAGILAVRHAQLVQEDLLAPFRNPPVVNLEPIPRLW